MTTAAVDTQPIMDAIEAVTVAAGVAFEVGRKPPGVTNTPYIVAWPDGGTVENRSMKSRDGWSTVVAFQCYGLSTVAVRMALHALRGAVLGLHGQVIAGRTVQMPEQQAPPPLSRDDDADPSLFMQYDEWRIRTS